MDQLQLAQIDNNGTYKQLVEDVLNGQGNLAMAYMVKRGKINFPNGHAYWRTQYYGGRQPHHLGAARADGQPRQ